MIQDFIIHISILHVALQVKPMPPFIRTIEKKMLFHVIEIGKQSKLPQQHNYGKNEKYEKLFQGRQDRS